jgi:hypothetical protein
MCGDNQFSAAPTGAPGAFARGEARARCSIRIAFGMLPSAEARRVSRATGNFFIISSLVLARRVMQEKFYDDQHDR